MKFEINNLLKNNTKAERDIKSKIELILTEMIRDSASDNVLAYLLGGSFGRGEGSVVKREGVYETTNDYDIYAICVDGVSKEEIKELEKRIEEKLKLKFFGIDIINLTLFNELIERNELSQTYFDFIIGSKLLWINDKYNNLKIWEKLNYVHENIKNYHVQIESAYDVLKTRMWCIIALANYKADDLYDHNYVSDYNFFYFQQVKLATAIIDAVLIAENRYITPFFTDKIREFKHSNFSKLKDTTFVMCLAEQKLVNSNIIQINKRELAQLYNLYCDCIQYVIGIDKNKYKNYARKEIFKVLYYKYIKREKISVWRIGDYKYIRNHNIIRLKNIQTKMRGVYE